MYIDNSEVEQGRRHREEKIDQRKAIRIRGAGEKHDRTDNSRKEKETTEQVNIHKQKITPRRQEANINEVKMIETAV